MNQDLIGKVISPEELLSVYPDRGFYRLTNKEERHNKFQYKTGLNTDILPFNPDGECKPGGLYFFHASQIPSYDSYCRDVHYIRKVFFTPESRIYVEEGKFKTNEFVLGEREKFFCIKFFLKKYLNEENSEQRCIPFVKEDGMNLRYITKNQTDEICKLAVQENGHALQFVENQTGEICKLDVQQYGYAVEYGCVKN